MIHLSIKVLKFVAGLFHTFFVVCYRKIAIIDNILNYKGKQNEKQFLAFGLEQSV